MKKKDINKENLEDINENNIVIKENEKTEVQDKETEEKSVQKEIKNEQPKTKKQQFLQFLKFLGFSLSAGAIQILSFELLYNWIGWKIWWASYLISVVLSVIWNFTFNRKFTFKSASNIPLAMTFVFIYYCIFTPISVFGGQALESIGWNGTLVTIMMMILNFVTEFLVDKFIVFNDKLMNKILRKN